MSKWSDRYSQVVTATRNGVLVRAKKMTCQQCQKVKAVHRHHDDYARPLDVMYLCVKCHRERHKHLLRWGVGGRPKGSWKYNFSSLPVGGFVFIPDIITRVSVYVHQYKTRQLPGSDFKSFRFNKGTIVFRTK